MNTPVTNRRQLTAIRAGVTFVLNELGAPPPPDPATPTPWGWRGTCGLMANPACGGGWSVAEK